MYYWELFKFKKYVSHISAIKRMLKWTHVSSISLINIALVMSLFLKYTCAIYLAVSGLSCSMWDLSLGNVLSSWGLQG